MKITFAPWGETLAELTDAARRAEAGGAEVIWVPELHRSATVAAAALAAATERARIGTGIALAFTRSPMITALEALDLDDLSEGRFILGLGSGVQRLNEDWHNVPFGKPVRHMREVVRNVRAFWETCTTGDPIDLPGEEEPMRIRGYQRPFAVRRADIPVHLAAMGPAMTRLAGEIGDGWISHELCSPRYLAERVLPELETGIARAEGKKRADVDVVVSACCSVSDDRATALRRVSGLVGFYASVRTYADFFDFHGLAEQQQAVIDAFRAGTGAEHLAETVSAEMIDALTMVGGRDEVAERIAGYEGLADSVKLSPPTHGLSAAETRAAQDELLALLPDLTGSAS
ncbi:LLM class flavin-dependent oxidoreductase [Actinomadura sp. GC306]|uniref:LLM class flavin-dependent oxidoreductase n=1 Tax=Actinomadura sp. GC306 TaxID=2530367 RepID=UPI00104B3C0A|nr:LLM class flavin-dependent oxidoreductase [Actinomadura sp. GC306]TDC61815.1 LLM class flavin-dependent oxidoreductase [Actinomadura sp. GC306]